MKVRMFADCASSLAIQAPRRLAEATPRLAMGRSLVEAFRD